MTPADACVQPTACRAGLSSSAAGKLTFTPDPWLLQTPLLKPEEACPAAERGLTDQRQAGQRFRHYRCYRLFSCGFASLGPTHHAWTATGRLRREIAIETMPLNAGGEVSRRRFRGAGGPDKPLILRFQQPAGLTGGNSQRSPPFDRQVQDHRLQMVLRLGGARRPPAIRAPHRAWWPSTTAGR